MYYIAHFHLLSLCKIQQLEVCFFAFYRKNFIEIYLQLNCFVVDLKHLSQKTLRRYHISLTLVINYIKQELNIDNSTKEVNIQLPQ